ncbi:MAG: sulfatase [Bacteroidales bacterium]|nr:MAG: sulfatase [Bacteroidales bacterium]
MIRILFSLLLVLTIMPFKSCWQEVPKPNFLFILVDDLGWADVGFNNPETFYETPNIDRLAFEGMRFTSGYAACPVCSPTRASIMTGKYPARLNTTDYFGAPQPETVSSHWTRNKPLLPANYDDRMPLEEITIAEALKEAGYATFFTGKWHLGPEGFWPEDQGFDINKGGTERGGPYGGNKYFSPYENPRLEDGPDGEHLPDRLASETVKFISEHQNQPFFAYLSFYSVHTPLMAREDLKEKYEKKRERFPADSWGEEGDRKVRLVQNHAVYSGMVEAMDLAVGKVLNYLRESGLDKNTVVFFMSDNGGLSTSEGHPTSNLPLRAGKGWLYEGGIREPFVIKWPGKTPSGTTCGEPVISTDFYPTILEMANLPLKPEQHMDGLSMVPLLLNKDKRKDRSFFWHYPHYGNQGGSPGAAIRQGNYKLIEFFEKYRNIELYDLSTDIGENNNLADSLPDVRDELLEILHHWQDEVDAKFPTPNSNYKK